MDESERALTIFADIIAKRPYDTSQVMVLLKPNNMDDNSDSEEGAGIDLASFGANKATDFFILKFLMCNDKTENTSAIVVDK